MYVVMILPPSLKKLNAAHNNVQRSHTRMRTMAVCLRIRRYRRWLVCCRAASRICTRGSFKFALCSLQANTLVRATTGASYVSGCVTSARPGVVVIRWRVPKRLRWRCADLRKSRVVAEVRGRSGVGGDGMRWGAAVWRIGCCRTGIRAGLARSLTLSGLTEYSICSRLAGWRNAVQLLY